MTEPRAPDLSSIPVALPLVARTCDCCGGADLEEVWAYRHVVQQRTRRYLWQVRNVVCRLCGFAFVSPAPEAGALLGYYADSFPASSTPDFSIERRLSLIDRQVAGGPAPVYVEVGSNHFPTFRTGIERRFRRTVLIEVNEACEPSARSTSAVASATADIVGCYFVLEHVVEPAALLRECARMLKPNGMLIVEVPDIHLYGDDPAGLYLCEHVNHFSTRTLERVAARASLRVVDASHEACSRPFGFAAVLTADPRVPSGEARDATEVERARTSLQAGVRRIRAFLAAIREVRERLESTAEQGVPTVVWAANDVSQRLLDSGALPASVTFVDSDPAKREYLADRLVETPAEAADRIRSAGLFVVCTAVYAEQVRTAIEALRGKPLAAHEIQVLAW
jgi:SAM-dependent methyltransferase